LAAPKISKGNKRIIHDCIYTMTFGFKLQLYEIQ
jgi:hypothetical protein